MFSTRLCCKHTQYPRTATDVQDSFVLEQMWIIVHGIAVRSGSDCILQHFFMNTFRIFFKKNMSRSFAEMVYTEMCIRISVTFLKLIRTEGAQEEKMRELC